MEEFKWKNWEITIKNSLILEDKNVFKDGYVSRMILSIISEKLEFYAYRSIGTMLLLLKDSHHILQVKK